MLLQDPINRNQIVNVLIETWFSDKKSEINTLFRIDAFKDFQDHLKEVGGKIYSVEELEEDEKVIVCRFTTYYC